jgi:transcriptional regulator with XRE-family HTH domain
MKHQVKVILEMENDARARGMTIAELCEKAGISPSTWWRWRTGASSPLMLNLEKVRLILDRTQLVRGRATRKSITGA